jgi:hypothetical protein
MTAPEIGGKYGYGLVASGYKDLAKAGWKKSIEELRRIGAHTEQKLFEAGEHATGLQSVPGKAAIDKVNHGLMILHTLTDDINRAVTQNMGKKFVKDLAEKSPEALKAFKSVPKSVQSRVNFALGEGNLEAAQDAMSNHLISKTQFIYGPAGRNKFARAVGPALSMFTKYPSEIASDLYLSPKNAQLAAKYLAPLALAMGGQWALEQTSSGTREKVQGLLGKNLASLAPVTSVTGLVNPPPAAKLAQSAVSAVDELIRERGLSGKKAAELRKAATPFVPFSGVYKKAMP